MEKVTVSKASVGKIYKTINMVQQELILSGGVGKNSRNDFQRYNFRGIDDVQNALSPLMAKHGLVILPEVLENKVKTYAGTNSKGKPANTTHVFLKVKYQMICVEDGSCHEVIVIGEANDTADKATNKAMSAAFKYMVLQAFCVPTETEAQNEADKFHNEVAPQQQGHQQQPQNNYQQQPQNNYQQRPQNNYQQRPQSNYQQRPQQQPQNLPPRNDHRNEQGYRENHNEQPQNNRRGYNIQNGRGDVIQDNRQQTPNRRQQQNSPQYIDYDQIQMLKNCLKEVNMAEFEFCHLAQIDSVESLTDNRFEQAIDFIYSRHKKAA